MGHIGRLMRILTATGILKSHGADTFSHTALSRAYLDTPEVEFWDLCVDEMVPVAYRLPDYMTAHSPNSILDPRKSPYSWANNAEGKVFYEVLLDHPDRLKRFNTAMTTQENALPVLGMFPFASLLDEEGDSERVLIVDVAGGRGQSLLQIKKEFEDTGKGVGERRMILQDRKQVLDAVPDDQLLGIEKMVIDFFQPQPVKRKTPTQPFSY
jgi:hypothetical protein